MPVVGTAGHVDHGKSSLLRALTGRDPDRWEEEKRRGLTIDLGFVWMTLPSGLEVSFVDVPGHQRFAKNMLAGIDTIDAALLVVAADEGWMPQTEEHLAILDIHNLTSGIVAITKIDKVDADLAELAALEAGDMLIGTSLEGAPVIQVSAVSGQGIREVVSSIDKIGGPIRHGEDPVRLWVDRVFSVAGAGTVVTGTLLGGSISVGDEIGVWPNGETVRVRGIESHEASVETATARRRVALNLAGTEVREIQRGTMVGTPGEWQPSMRMIARLRPVVRADEIPQTGSFQIHIGSAWASATVRKLEDDFYLIRTDRALPLRTSDRFTLRDSGRLAVVGGGVVIDPAPPRRRPNRSLPILAAVDPDSARDTLANALLEVRGRESVESLFAQTGGRVRGDTVVDGVAFTSQDWLAIRHAIRNQVAAYHMEHPLRVGVPCSTVASQLGLSSEMVKASVRSIDDVEESGPYLTEVGRKPIPTAAQALAWDEVFHQLSEASLAAPRLADLSLEEEHLHYLLREGQLIRLSDEFVLLPHHVEQIRATITEMDSPFTVADFRDATGLSRRHLIPYLEWSDKEGLTTRDGDERRTR